jgi:hypothetical protein
MAIPGNIFVPLALMRLLKILYLGTQNVTVLITKHVMVEYGMLLIETLVISFLFLFILSTGVLVISLNNPGAFGGNVTDL